MNTTILVDSALRLADMDGADALSLRRLAAEHHVTPMALYWHFSDKEQLLLSIAERIHASAVTVTVTEHAWDESLVIALTAIVDAYRAHPAVTALASARLLETPSGLAVLEGLLAALDAGGFSAARAAETAVALHAAIAWTIPVQSGSSRLVRRYLDERSRGVAGAVAGLDRVLDAADVLLSLGSSESFYERSVGLLVAGVRVLRDGDDS